jgi:hypothetical protein
MPLFLFSVPSMINSEVKDRNSTKVAASKIGALPGAPASRRFNRLCNRRCC